MDFKKIKKAIIDFRNARDWKQFHNPKDLAAAIAIEAGELQEKFLWKSQEESYDIWKNDKSVHEEFADILNFMILFAEECNIDIEKIMLEKIEKNAKKYPVEKAKWKSDKYDKL
jgi:NTP pyrophosphatase (non-canonical NTP hydrolase)